MKKIWAPWRSSFIYNRKRKGCIFCGAVNSKSLKGNFVIKKTKHSICMLNIYPYNNGHLLIAPKRHKPSLTKLNKEELLDLMALLNDMNRLLDKVLKPEGYNMGINIGKVAGAGFPGHVHIHIVPRWNGDTNFMPTFSGTKVISESLESLYRRLTEHA